MNDDEAFKLNSLNRFQKRSRLVLEAHSHCEVPAGCGGAVFQWVNPAQGVAVRVHVQSPLRVVEARLDGVEVPGVGVRLKPGPHVLALALEPPKKSAGAQAEPWLLVWLELRAPGAQASPEQRLAEGSSRADGTWLTTRTPPPEGWPGLDFDERGWTALKQRQGAGAGLEDWARRNFQSWVERGSEPLAVPAERVWVRKRFRTTEPTARGTP